MQVAGLQGMTAAIGANPPANLGFVNGANGNGITYSEASDMNSRLGLAQGGYEHFQFWMTSYAGTKACTTSGGNSLNNYPFFAVPSAASKYATGGGSAPTTFQFSGGTLTVTLSACQSNGTPQALGPGQTYTPYQTLTLTFPPATLAPARVQPGIFQ